MLFMKGLIICLSLLSLEPVRAHELRYKARKIAMEHSIEPQLFEAIIEQESSFIVNAYNKRTKDYGLGQINEQNIKVLKLDKERLLRDPEYNLRAAAFILRQMKRQFPREALYWARYNCGTKPIAVHKRPGCMKYASKVLKRLEALQKPQKAPNYVVAKD